MLYKPWRTFDDLGHHLSFADAWAAQLRVVVTRHDNSTFEHKDMVDVDWTALEAEITADQGRLNPTEKTHQFDAEQRIDIGQETGMTNSRGASMLGSFTPNPTLWPTQQRYAAIRQPNTKQRAFFDFKSNA